MATWVEQLLMCCHSTVELPSAAEDYSSAAAAELSFSQALYSSPSMSADNTQSFSRESNSQLFTAAIPHHKRCYCKMSNKEQLYIEI